MLHETRAFIMPQLTNFIWIHYFFEKPVKFKHRTCKNFFSPENLKISNCIKSSTIITRNLVNFVTYLLYKITLHNFVWNTLERNNVTPFHKIGHFLLPDTTLTCTCIPNNLPTDFSFAAPAFMDPWLWHWKNSYEHSIYMPISENIVAYYTCMLLPHNNVANDIWVTEWHRIQFRIMNTIFLNTFLCY